MRQFDALIGPGENHLMIACGGAAAQRREADVARNARAGVTVAGADRSLIEIDAAAVRGSLTEQIGGPRRRIDLLPVVHFENLDVEILVERLRHLLDQRRQQINAKAHIARLHHDGLRGHALDDRVVRCRETRGADDVNDTALGRNGDIGDGRGGNGEIENAVGVLRQRPQIGRQFDTVAGQSGEQPRILAQQFGTRCLQRAGQNAPRGFGNGADQGPPHPATGSSNDQAHIGHFQPSKHVSKLALAV